MTPAARALASSRTRGFARRPGPLGRGSAQRIAIAAHLCGVNDQHGGGSAVGELLRDVAEPLTLTCVHALAANDNDRRAIILGHIEKGIRWVLVAGVRDRVDALAGRFRGRLLERRFRRLWWLRARNDVKVATECLG